MLAQSPALLQKLYDKGVDIGAAVIASTISAGIVAAIATATWRWNKRRDLRHEDAKQRQQHRIAEELAEQTRRAEARERDQRLAAQREIFGDAMAKPIHQNEAAELWDGYLEWLSSEQLHTLPKNLPIYNGYRRMGEGLRGITDPTVVTREREALVQLIRETELPLLEG